MNKDKSKGDIVFTKYGPYAVVDADTNKIETPRVVSLCRCGESENKPFCDGSHGKVGFVGERESEDVNGTKDYVGEKINKRTLKLICNFCQGH